MSLAFRQKLATEIASKVAAREGGKYFDYGTISITKDRWTGEVRNKLDKQIANMKEGGLTPISKIPVFPDFAGLGENILSDLRKKAQTSRGWKLIKGTTATSTKLTIKYKRKDKSGSPNTYNIEASILKELKIILKKRLNKVALEYVHGTTGTGQFDNSLFRSNQGEVRQALQAGESMKGAQGTNVQQAIAQAFDESVATWTNWETFATIVQKFDDIFGYEHKVGKNHSRTNFKRTLEMKGFVDPKHIADNLGDYDKAIRDDIIDFLNDTNSATAVEIMKRLKKANPKDWKGVGDKKMGMLWSESPNIIDSLDRIAKINLIQGIFGGHKVKPNLRFKVNKKLIQQGLRELGTTKGTSVKTKTKKSTRSKQKAGKKARQVKQRVQQMSNPLALRNLLNDVISEAVAMKMKAPALQFRTGRFANSVEVTDVLVGPRGGTQIEYTYQRNPYETFEPGNKQGSTQRDPRKIIGASIRELAMGIIGRQPTSLRRN